jgi:hypothetical protein
MMTGPQMNQNMHFQAPQYPMYPGNNFQMTTQPNVVFGNNYSQAHYMQNMQNFQNQYPVQMPMVPGM